MRLRRFTLISGAVLLLPSVCMAQAYPSSVVSDLRASCSQRKDIPAAAMSSYCSCYVDATQTQIPWPDFQSLDVAIKTKGLTGLDANEKAILKKAVAITYDCSQKANQR